MIVVAVHLTGTIFGCQIVLSMLKKMVNENLLGGIYIRSIIPNFKYSYQPENAMKNFVIGT